MPIHNARASVAVRGLQAIMAWCENLLGQPADSRQISGVAEWQLDGGGWLQGYQNPGHAAAGSVRLAVSDRDAQIADFKTGGIDPGAPLQSQKINVVMITDPDGNSLAVAQALARTMEHRRGPERCLLAPTACPSMLVRHADHPKRR